MIRKSENFLNEKNVKITKREHACKSYASTYNAEILNSFNPELQFTDTKSYASTYNAEILNSSNPELQFTDTESPIKSKIYNYRLN